MVRIEETMKRIKELMASRGVQEISLVNKEGLGIVLDSVWNCAEDNVNIEVRTIDADLKAHTNVGFLSLSNEIKDEDDWFTLEDCVNDMIADFCKSPNPLSKKTVWNVLVTMTSESMTEPESKIKSFSSEEKAEAWLAKDYAEALEEFSDDENCVYEKLNYKNYHNNAFVELGFKGKDGMMDDLQEVHYWRVFKNIIDNEEV